MFEVGISLKSLKSHSNINNHEKIRRNNKKEIYASSLKYKKLLQRILRIVLIIITKNKFFYFSTVFNLILTKNFSNLFSFN